MCDCFIASYQASVVEDELRHSLLDSWRQKGFYNWFRSLTRYCKSGQRDLKTWTRLIDELQTNERSFSNVIGESTDAGSKVLLAEDPNFLSRPRLAICVVTGGTNENKVQIRILQDYQEPRDYAEGNCLCGSVQA